MNATINEVVLEQLKLRAGDPIPAGWDERARAALKAHEAEHAALEAVAEAANKLLYSMSSRASTAHQFVGNLGCSIEVREALAALAAVRGGSEVVN